MDAAKSTPMTLKSRIQDSEVVYDMSLLTFSLTIDEITDLAGYNFVLIYMEHVHGGIPEPSLASTPLPLPEPPPSSASLTALVKLPILALNEVESVATVECVEEIAVVDGSWSYNGHSNRSHWESAV